MDGVVGTRGGATVDRSPVAWRPLTFFSVLYAAVMMVASVGYGYHRDELYFVMLGGHPAAGYIDQPPLAPLLAGAMDALGHGSLTVLRIPAALAGALVVLVTGLIARELGARRSSQVLAAIAMACSAILFSAAHLATTTVFDLLWWTTLSWLVVRALRDGGRSWLWVGLVFGVALETKTLVLLLAGGLVIGLVAVGPRQALWSRWLWLAALVGLVGWAPNLWWQLSNGVPQLEMSRQIAAGSSGTSQPRALIVPMQFVLIGPLLAPIWLRGLWRLARAPHLALWRCFAVAYPVVLVILLVTGGKSYYLCGLYPVLLAAGVGRGPGRGAEATSPRRSGTAYPLGLVLGLVVSVAVNATLFLPILPADRVQGTPVQAINYDAGEQMGWPEFAQAVDAARRTLPVADQASAIMLGANYGEAGAVHRYLPSLPAYSGHNSFYALGPPPESTRSAIVVGYPEDRLRAWFGHVEQVGTITNTAGIDNDEAGEKVWRCTDPTAAWSRLWPEMRRVG